MTVMSAFDCDRCHLLPPLLLACLVLVMQVHVAGAIRRGRATRCSCCGLRGATLKCAERSCCQLYHLTCARAAGCTLIVSACGLAGLLCFAIPP